MAMFSPAMTPVLTPPSLVVKQWGQEMPSAVKYSNVPCFCVIIIVAPKGFPWGKLAFARYEQMTDEGKAGAMLLYRV